MEKLVMNEMLSMANIHVPDNTMACGDMGEEEMLYNQLLDQLGGKKKRRSGKKKSKKSKKSKRGGGCGAPGHYRHGSKGACGAPGHYSHVKSSGKKSKKSKKGSKKRKGSKKSKRSKRGGSIKNKQFGGYIRYDDEFNLF